MLMTSAIDPTKPVAGAALTADVRANFAAAKSEIEALQAAGDFISAYVASLSAIPLTNAVATNVTSITLPAGDWDVSGAVGFAPAATTSITSSAGGINTVSGVLPNIATGSLFRVFQPAFVPGAVFPIFPVPTSRLLLAAPTLVYLVALSSFTVAANAAFGFIGARRVR
jgi:hypothetical protein